MQEASEVQGDTPKEAWLAAAEVLLNAPGHRISNLVVRINEPKDLDPEFSAELDDVIGNPKNSVRRVARTIMPAPIVSATAWEVATARMLPKLPARGFYFRRMVDYTGDGTVNQIRNVIAAFNRITSNGRWADPGPIVLERPGSEAIARVGYPCLSQVQLHRYEGELRGTAVYRSHYYHDKAYGNFVGLSRLMELVAAECELLTGSLVVVSTDARIQKITTMRGLLS